MWRALYKSQQVIEHYILHSCCGSREGYVYGLNAFWFCFNGQDVDMITYAISSFNVRKYNTLQLAYLRFFCTDSTFKSDGTHCTKKNVFGTNVILH